MQGVLVQLHQDSSPTVTQIEHTMLDEYECGMDVERIDAVLAEIEHALVPLIDRVLSSSSSAVPPDTIPLFSSNEFPIHQQEALSKQLVQAIWV